MRAVEICMDNELLGSSSEWNALLFFENVSRGLRNATRGKNTVQWEK
jgi:hypothetical protein